MRILYGVQGTGNGHIGRARAMANALQAQKVTVDFLFSGRAASQYFSMDAFGQYQTRNGLTFITQRGKVNYWQTLINARPLTCWREITDLRLNSYDLVLNDFEPVSAWAARRQKVTCIGISHQSAFRYAVPKHSSSWFDARIMRHFAPADFHLGLHWYHFEQPVLPPIVNILPQLNQTTEEKQVTYTLVYLPFEVLTETVSLLHQMPQQHFVYYHPQVKQQYTSHNVTCKPLSHRTFQADLKQCNGVITNGGFELPSEALVLGKNLLLKPLQGQFEQQSNAATLVQLGLAQTLNKLNVSSIQQWLQLPAAKPVYYPDVASALAKWIVDGKWHQTEPLTQLWQQVRFPEYFISPTNYRAEIN